ncbi:hypothetical protein HPB50_010374 [Hyalomma asiaticum]|uniref:Uncharacterized protein n=1 Tax=Hyalomma asiaticum TaxID=266040 RepID=A0ACB7TG17_HYAAI|nr:hypothetical protein HPB50_010374 [Hyalomma asiaticum]
MTSLSISSSKHLVQQVLRYVPVRDLFSCSQVNALWKRVSLALLRNKLKWVLCTASAGPACEERRQNTIPVTPKLNDATKCIGEPSSLQVFPPRCRASANTVIGCSLCMFLEVTSS